MLVELRQVYKQYRAGKSSVRAVEDVSLGVEEGEFLAICGPSGCGKSTLLLLIGGLLRPDRGEVFVGGSAIHEMNAAQRASFRGQNVGFVFQQFHLVPYLSVHDNILAARLGGGSGEDGGARADELIHRFGLENRRRHRPGQLSTGERQRTALARAMMNRPRLLLADEPTGNLDRENAVIVLDFLREFVTDGGAVILVTHDEHAAARADRIATVDSGKLTPSTAS